MGNCQATETLNASNNEKNLCCIYLAARKTGPVAIAFAEIYLLLNQLAPGQTVREYCQNILGYSNTKYRNIFNTDERNILAGPWDPKLQDVSFLYKLLFHACGLSPDGQNWTDPAYALEFNLHTAKNRRNDTMHSKSELTDAELYTLFQEVEHSVKDAMRLAGVNKGMDVSTHVGTFKSKMRSYNRKYKPLTGAGIACRLGASGATIVPLVGLAMSTIGFAIWISKYFIASGSAAGAGMACGSVIVIIVPHVGLDMSTIGFGPLVGLAMSTIGFGIASWIFKYSGATSSETKDQIRRDDLITCLQEAEELEFHGISVIIQRQLNQ